MSLRRKRKLRRRRNRIRFVQFLIIMFILLTISGVMKYSRYPLYYKEDIKKYSDQNNLDPYLVASIINVESGFDKKATSSKDARGLMQIAEQTGRWAAEELKIKNYKNETLFIPEQNIRIGTWYFNKLEKEFDGELDLILAAYNGGSGNVRKWLGDEKYSKDGLTLKNIPFKETENYLKRVKKSYKKYKKIYRDEDFEKEKFHSLYVNYIYKVKGFIRDIK